MIGELCLSVPGEGYGTRLDRFLRERLPRVPARSVRHVLEQGSVRVDGVVSRKGTILSGGERVTVTELPEEEDWLPAAGEVPGASLLFEDGHLVVLDKPVHVHTEPHRPLEKGTLAGHLLHLFPWVVRIAPRPGLTLATRLDYVTSGAVPAAISEAGERYLSGEREQGRLVKRYACVVEGVLGEEMVLTDRIETDGGEKVRVRRGLPDDDPRRWTRVIPLAQAVAGQTLVRAEIRRGKRHQIRAHLAAAGFPIVGDRNYGAVPAEGPGALRLMLHAAEVTFRLVNGGEVTVRSPIPASFGVGAT